MKIYSLYLGALLMIQFSVAYCLEQSAGVTGKEAHEELTRRHAIRFFADPGEEWHRETKFFESVTKVADKKETEFRYLPLNAERSSVAGVTCIYKVPNNEVDLNDNKVFYSGEPFCFDSMGNRIEHIQRDVGSATGTPPWFMYENYLASINVPTTKRVIPGASRRIMFFKGLPRER